MINIYAYGGPECRRSSESKGRDGYLYFTMEKCHMINRDLMMLTLK